MSKEAAIEHIIQRVAEIDAKIEELKATKVLLQEARHKHEEEEEEEDPNQMKLFEDS